MAGSAKVHGLLYKMRDLDKSYALNSPTPTERGELDVLIQINGYIAKIGTPITIVAGKHTFKDVYGANKVEGTPKADIALVMYDGKKKKFVDVCFISHKMGTDASGFQQYSGITTKADGAKSGSISKDKNVVAITAQDDTIVSAVSIENIFGCQFHPEKSYIDGIEIMKNFIEI